MKIRLRFCVHAKPIIKIKRWSLQKLQASRLRIKIQLFLKEVRQITVYV